MSEDTMSENDKICAFCKGYGDQKCGDCKIVYYCCREHQKSDWKRHSKNCRMVKLVDDPKIGRHYIATRNIEMDEIVIEEKKPLLVTPEPLTEAICLNCYVPLTHDNAIPCKNCGWPLCRDCKEHGPECQLTMKYHGSKVKIGEYSVPNELYYSITIMRAIALREKSPGDFKKLLNLEDHCAKPGERIIDPIQYANFLKTWMGMCDLNAAVIARIIGIMEINAYRTVTPKENKYAAVFDKASYCTHDCHPNCMWDTYYNVNTGSKIVIRAVRMIPKGQLITITYTDSLYGTEKRRRVLGESKFFECMCERCKDPTEFGTMFSAVKCLRENCTGYMLPPTFLVSPLHELIPDWACKKCNLTAPSTTIDEIINEASSQYDKLDTENSNELKKFIDDRSKILHPNHFHIVNAQIVMVLDDFVKDFGLLSNELVTEQITLVKNLRGLVEVIGPTCYTIRGRLLLLEYKYTVRLNRGRFFRGSVKSLSVYKNLEELSTEGFRLILNETEDNTPNKDKLIRIQLKESIELSMVLKKIVQV